MNASLESLPNPESESTSSGTSNASKSTWYLSKPPMPPKPWQNWFPSCDLSEMNSSTHPNFLYSLANHSLKATFSVVSSWLFSASWKCFGSFCCSGVRIFTSVAPVTVLRSSQRSCGQSSQTPTVSTAPISKQFKVPLMPKQNLPVSCAI